MDGKKHRAIDHHSHFLVAIMWKVLKVSQNEIDNDEQWE
jgi:hypothetical protein